MSILDQINQDLVTAQKSKNEIEVSTLRMAIANLNNAKIAKGADLNDEDTVAELLKDAKRHKESIAAFEGGNRTDLAQKEKAELEILARYLPAQLSEEEIKKTIDEVVSQINPTGLADMGKVMSAVMAKIGKSADGSTVSSLVKEKLSQL